MVIVRVRLGIAAVVVVLLATALTGCAFFQMSPYTNAVGYIEKRVSLAGTALSADSSGNANVEYVSDGTTSLIYLIQYPSVGSSHAVILDPDMSVRFSGSNAGINRFNAVEPNGSFDIGTLYFDPTADPFDLQSVAYPGGYSLGGSELSFYDPTSVLMYSLSSATDTLVGNDYTVATAGTWQWGSQVSYAVSGDGVTNYHVRQVLDDRATGNVTVVLDDSGENIFVIRFGDTQYSSLTTPLLSNYQIYTQNFSGSYIPAVAVCRTGLIEATNKALTYYATDGSGDTAVLDFPDLSYNLRITTSPDGSAVYVYDPDRESLYKVRPWW